MIRFHTHHRLTKPKGSILLWSVMLGFVLTSVFFFFGMRQRMNTEVQRDTAEILNARAYLESYADYLQNTDEEWDSGPEAKNAFDDITGSLTQTVNEIEGSVDTSEFGIAPTDSKNTYQFNGDIFIEWNKCENNENLMPGDLIVHDATGDVIYEKIDRNCVEGRDYNDVVSITIQRPFTIKTLNAPFQYRITGQNLTDNKWHLELTTQLSYGKKIKVKRVFESP